MKKILGLTVAALLVMALVGGGTWAYFSDTETSSNNTFTAGTLDLTLTDASEDGTDAETATWVFSGMKPTDSGTATLTINNAGNIAGFLDLSSVALVETEETNPESETNIEGDGDLGGLLKVWMFWDKDGDGTFDEGDDANIYGTSEEYATFSGIAAAYDADRAIAAAAADGITMKYSWPTSANDNDAQGDAISFSFLVELDQNED